MDEDGGKSKFPTNKVEMMRNGKVILPLVALRREPPLAQASITIINQSFHQKDGQEKQIKTGYCDAQCPADLKFINGEANCMDWTGN